MAWYNDYRPTNFDQVIGQNLVKTVLQNALELNKIKHGYLLSGPKGVGKTTIARIFANELNSLNSNPQASMDIIELDAASNSGVDNIRQLIDSAQTPPFAGKYKIFIIDEVHMLSKSAMNALLKILEEPPAYLIFLLATTNPEKLLPTVLSRLTKLALTSHSIEDIVSQLGIIATKEKMDIDEESLILIAKRSSGGQRDAINLLETLFSYGLEKYSIKETSNLLGLINSEIFDQISNLFLTQDFAQIKTIIQDIENIGLDGEGFLAQFLDYLLESVFDKPSASQRLILPVASILDLKLPINTIHSAFALIQTEITKHNLSNIVLKSAITEKKTEFLVEVEEKELQTSRHSGLDPESPTTEDEVKASDNVLVDFPAEIEGILKQVQDEGAFSSENQAKSNPLSKMEVGSGLLNFASPRQESNLQDIEDSKVVFDCDIVEDSVALPNELSSKEESNKNLTETEFKRYLTEILGLKACPPPLKIVSNDINVEPSENNLLRISISSPIFLPQVKNEKTLKFISEYLLQKTQNNYSIEVTLRDPSLKNPIMPTQTNTNLLHDLGVEQDSQNIQIIQPKEVRQDMKVGKEKIFYKIYGGLMPENNISDISNLKFYIDTIPFPDVKVLETKTDDWNNEIENMFDF